MKHVEAFVPVFFLLDWSWEAKLMYRETKVKLVEIDCSVEPQTAHRSSCSRHATTRYQGCNLAELAVASSHCHPAFPGNHPQEVPGPGTFMALEKSSVTILRLLDIYIGSFLGGGGRIPFLEREKTKVLSLIYIRGMMEKLPSQPEKQILSTRTYISVSNNVPAEFL